MKAVQLAINEALPPDMRDYNRVYDKNTLNDLQAELAVKYPEDYGRIIDDIISVSRDSIWRIAPTATLSDIMPVFDKKSKIDKMMEKARLARKTIKDRKKQDEYIKHLYENMSVELEKDTYDAAKNLPYKNNLFDAVSSGARGNKTQLKAIVTTPGVYTDYKGETIPIFSRKSYGEGISLPAYLASTYGTRNCLAGDTMVRMGNGETKAIKDIEPGEWVMGYNKKTGKTYPVQVIKKFDQGKQQVMKVSFDDGSMVKATVEHKFLTSESIEDDQ